jgi:hypothetical protein
MEKGEGEGGHKRQRSPSPPAPTVSKHPCTNHEGRQKRDCAHGGAAGSAPPFQSEHDDTSPPSTLAGKTVGSHSEDDEESQDEMGPPSKPLPSFLCEEKPTVTLPSSPHLSDESAPTNASPAHPATQPFDTSPWARGSEPASLVPHKSTPLGAKERKKFKLFLSDVTAAELESRHLVFLKLHHQWRLENSASAEPKGVGFFECRDASQALVEAARVHFTLWYIFKNPGRKEKPPGRNSASNAWRKYLERSGDIRCAYFEVVKISGTLVEAYRACIRNAMCFVRGRVCVPANKIHMIWI